METTHSSKSNWKSNRSLGALLACALVCVAIAPCAQAKNLGDWTQADINDSVKRAVHYIDSKQNPNGSFGNGSTPIAEAGMALVAYSVLAQNDFNTLATYDPNYPAHVRQAVIWLLSQQNAAGWWGDVNCPSFGDHCETYGTGIVIGGLDWLRTVPGMPTGLPTAIDNGRTFLVNEFQGPLYTGCNSSDGSGTSYYCGGWNYETDKGRSDESNTGFAMFGLQFSGGVPPTIWPDNINWQRHVQAFKGTPPNPFATRNDGGGSYQPLITSGPDSSNANDTGTMLFGFAYDKMLGSATQVVAGLKFADDILDVYELERQLAVPIYVEVYHTGPNEDGSCLISPGCDWAFSGDGGFHYSMFSLAKGIGAYNSTVSLTDKTNWYAKVVDLLLSQQDPDGHWPPDGRDDEDELLATEFSVPPLMCLGCQGYIEICKASDPNHPVTGQFTFTATGPDFNTGPIQVPVGQCSGSIKVSSGGVTVTETPVIGVAVSDVTAIAFNEIGFRQDELSSWTLPELHAIVGVLPGDEDEETLTTFTNYAAPPGIFKLCKVPDYFLQVGTVTFKFTVTINNQSNDYPITVPPGQTACILVNTNLPVNTPVMVREHFLSGFVPESIQVNEGQVIACTPPSIYCGIVNQIPGVTEMTFTNKLNFEKRCMECDNLK